MSQALLSSAEALAHLCPRFWFAHRRARADPIGGSVPECLVLLTCWHRPNECSSVPHFSVSFEEGRGSV